VRSSLPPPCPSAIRLCRSLHARRCRLRAISGRATITAPPPSHHQQSSRCSGSAITGESRTSSTVTTSRSIGVRVVLRVVRSGDLHHAICSEVVPYSCMWRSRPARRLFAVTMPYGASNGRRAPRRPAPRCVPARAFPSAAAGERDKGDNCNLPAAIASARAQRARCRRSRRCPWSPRGGP